MALLPDPAALETAARHIRGHADDLRGRASRLAAAAETVRWHSPAASAFRGDVRGLASAFRRAAAQIDDAADALRRHAGAVRRAEDVIRAAEQAARSVERSTRNAVQGAMHAGKDLAHALGL